MLKIQPYKTALDKGNAYWMAKLSKEVYQSKKDNSPDEKSILESIKKEDSEFLKITSYSHKSSQAMFIEHKQYLCIAFRGTDEIADWLDNINVAIRSEIFGKFHSGFWKATLDIWQDIYRDYQKAQKEQTRPTFLTGHSLGGAMASVASALFLNDDIPFTSCYTFGQPRVVDRETARLMNSEFKGNRFFRFQNNNDIVTRIPARLMNYSHIGNYFYIDTNKKIHQDIGFWYRFLDGVKGVVEDIGDKDLDMIEDHCMSQYLQAIEKWDWNKE